MALLVLVDMSRGSRTSEAEEEWHYNVIQIDPDYVPEVAGAQGCVRNTLGAG